MGLFTEEVETVLSGLNIKYYENLGYEIPTNLDAQNRKRIKKGTKIIVNAYDLYGDSHTIVNIKCDNHECDNIDKMEWRIYKKKFINNKYYCKQCRKKINSFAQYLIDMYGKNALDLYWDYKKNKITPWEIQKGSDNYVYIKCQNKQYHDSYRIKCSNFLTGKRCPYCCNFHGKVHKLDSLGSLYPQALQYWSDKNKKSPYEYSPMSNQEVWFKCQEGKHEDYRRSINHAVTLNFRCPICSKEKSESILQEKVRLYLSEILEYKLNHENKCSIVPINPKNKYQLPFDNEVIDLKLIIEVHGIQHYELLRENAPWLKNQSPEEYLKQRKLIDRYKKAVAECNGYFYLEIPYWTDDEEETYKELINNKINKIIGR